MDFTEKTVASEPIFNGAIIRVRLDRVSLPNGKLAPREVVAHPGGVAVLPLHDDGTVTVVRQYRYPFHRVVTELPAGKLDPDEDHRVCGLRELSEETGLTPDRFTYLGSFLASPGFSDEVLHLYLAQGLHEGPRHPDEDEFLALSRVPFETLLAQVMDGTLEDAKTVIGILKTKVFLGL